MQHRSFDQTSYQPACIDHVYKFLVDLVGELNGDVVVAWRLTFRFAIRPARPNPIDISAKFTGKATSVRIRVPSIEYNPVQQRFQKSHSVGRAKQLDRKRIFKPHDAKPTPRSID